MLEKIKGRLAKYYEALNDDEIEKEIRKRMATETNRAEAKANCLKEKLAKQAAAKQITFTLWTLWVVLTVIVGAIVSGIFFFLGAQFLYQVLAFLGFPLIVNTLAIGRGLCFVEQNNEYVVLLFGKWFTTWDSGWHVKLPFFMFIKGRVAVQPKTVGMVLNMDGTDGAEVNFSNATSSVTAEIFFSIYGSHRAVFNVDDLRKGIRIKTDSGLRAYYGKMSLDEAISTKSDTKADDIITLRDTDADQFKKWGAEIESIAITDIALPQEVKEQRNKVLAAEKAREVAVIEIETAKNKADADLEAAKIAIETAQKKAEADRIAKEMLGKAAGQEIKSLMTMADIKDSNVAAAFILSQQYIEAVKTGKVVIVAGQNTEAPLTGAQLAATFQTMMSQTQSQPPASQTPPAKTKQGDK